MLGGLLREHGVVVKRCRDCLRVALVYPAIYSGAVASLAYQNMYYMLNSFDYVYAERIVASRMAGSEPPPCSLETGRSLRDFDIIVAPISYELDYVTLARILHAAGVPFLRSQRRGGRYPLIVVGGPVPSMNPLVALEAADVVAVGEAEPILPRLVEAAYTEGVRGVLDGLACSEGFLAAGCGGRVRKAVVADLDSAYHTVMQFRIPGSGEPWGEAFMVEASRGCRHMCSFCMEAHFLMPLRHRSYGRLREFIVRGLEANGVRRVAFYALSFFDHPAADRLLELVAELGAEASIGSLRADTLTEDRVEAIARLGQRVLTIAPETLDSELCRVLRKCIGYELVVEEARWAWRRGMHVKLYLMLGVPGETEGHVERYAEKLRELAASAPPVRDALRLTVNPLIPKPHTPMQYHPLIQRREYEARLRILHRVRSRVLSVDALSYRCAYAQTAIAMGDEAVARVIDEWARLGGRLGQLWTAARRLGVNLDSYVYGSGRRYRWHELVDLGLPEKALRRAYHYLTGTAG
jgi:radical SAM superfamily enzyme YgiQ (UPF0313 family)